MAGFSLRRVSSPPDPPPPLERPPPPLERPLAPLERPLAPPDRPPPPPDRPLAPLERFPFPEPFFDFCAGAEGLAAVSTDSGRAGRVSPIFGRAAGVGGIDGTALGAVGVRVAVIASDISRISVPPVPSAPSPMSAASDSSLPVTDPGTDALDRPRPRDPRRRRFCPVLGAVERGLPSSAAPSTGVGSAPSAGVGSMPRGVSPSPPTIACSDRGIPPLLSASAATTSPVGAVESTGTLTGFSTGGPVIASDIEFPSKTAHDARS